MEPVTGQPAIQQATERMAARIPGRVIVEALDGHGRVLWRERVALGEGRHTFTIGRSVEADVMLDDPYAAALHASVELTPDGRLLAVDLGSVNGLIVRGKRVAGGSALELPDSTLQIGRTRLRIRTGLDTLVPERPDRPLASALERRAAEIAVAAAAVSALHLVYESWLLAPRDLTMTVATALGYAAGIACVWVAFWALLSRIMQGEWRWLRHAAIYLGITSAFFTIAEIVDLGGFLLALPHPTNGYVWMGAVALGFGLFLHLTHASHVTPARAALVAAILPVVLIAGSEWLQMRNRTRDVNYIGASLRIYPPALRLVPPAKLEDYFAKAISLRELADRRLTEAVAEDEAESY